MLFINHISKKGITNTFLDDDKYLKNNCLIMFYSNEKVNACMKRNEVLKKLILLAVTSLKCFPNWVR